MKEGLGKNGQIYVGTVAVTDANFGGVKTLTVFYGEFDSGSERTLAAWIRHASRTGTSVVAIQLKF